MIYRRVVMSVLIVGILMILISGCNMIKKKDTGIPLDKEDPETEGIQEGEDDSLRQTILFYQDDYGYLVPIMRKIKWEEGIAKAALAKLIENPEEQQAMLDMGLKPLLPANTGINGISIKDGVAKVDLSKEAMVYPDVVAENNMVQGIVMTLTEFPAINKVQLLFDGERVESLSYGTPVGEPIESQNINLELSSDYQGGGQEITVFYHNTTSSRFDYLVPITKITSDPELNLETAMKELFNGPKEGANLRLDVPHNTELIDVQMDDGITFVNLSKEFNSIKDSENESIVLKAITMTAKQFPGVAEVKILVEGQDYVGSGTPVTPTFANEY